MHKVLIVASTEFANSVRTKAFMVSMVLVPVLMVGMMAFQRAMMERVDTSDHAVVIVDETGRLADAVARAADEHNRAVVGVGGKAIGPRFLVQSGGSTIDDQQRLRLSEQVRAGRLFAFVEIPADTIDADRAGRIRYYSNHPSYDALPKWLETTVTAMVVQQRFQQSGVDRAVVEKLTRRVNVAQMGLMERTPEGEVKPAVQVDQVRLVAVPMVLMFLLFVPVMTITPQLVNAVIEEKMSRISEVLLGSVTPFELMLGKLAGAGGVSVVLALSYVAGAYAVAIYYGYADIVRVPLLLMFALFLVLAMLLYGSMYLAVGAACSTLKDAQSMMTPVAMISVLPMIGWTAIMKSPDSAFAVGASLFPLATPYLM
ncbi:MAG: ABC transporter permease, partial [Bacteroidales bacterium]